MPPSPGEKELSSGRSGRKNAEGSSSAVEGKRGVGSKRGGFRGSQVP